MNFLIFINFKTYKYGEDVLKLAKIIETFNNKIVIGVQPTDIFLLSKKTNLKIFSQHVDFFEPGRNTGFITIESIKSCGASGTFLNHSEHKLSLSVLERTIKRCKDKKIKTAVFVQDLKEAKEVEKFSPDYIIYEPPELIAGDISVSKAKPKILLSLKENLKKEFLVGAGIKTREDVIKSLKLGAAGVAISSVLMRSKNPKKVLIDLFDF
ncbi:MAG: triose-phosphate isomerase [Candidatus Pacearchaeota archaeon]